MDRDLLLTNGLGVVLILAVVLFPDSMVRIMIGVPFVLLFPGYTLICALFPKNGDLEIVERVALSIGLSLAVVPLMGLVLNYTPWGIRLYPVLLALFLFTLSMSAATGYRRKRIPAEERFAPRISVLQYLPRWGGMNKTDRIMLVGLVACVVMAGVLTAYFASMPRIGERFTEFYVLGPGGKIEDYPTNMTLGESGNVILGVVNHEYEEATYKVVVELGDETIRRIEGIGLRHEEKWEQDLTFTPNGVGEKMKLQFLLYKEGDNEPYRSLHLWITVNPLT